MRWMIPLLLIMSASAACAETVVTVETVPVADVGNVADSVTGYGSVGYAYRIGKFEVTIGQYAAFLNSVARSNTNTYIVNLWSGSGATPGGMTNGNIAGIARTGSLGAYTYTVVGPYGGVQLSQTSASNRPVTEVSWFDAARFCNWLHNGATNGADTEMGAYTLNGATSGIVTKNSDARWWIPTYNEWFKAAYYKGGGSNAGYWLYATQSDSPPGNRPGGALNQANYKVANKFSVTQSTAYSPSQNYLLDVGAFSNSASAYGTFDQAASVWEWNDAVFGADSRGVMGGSWANPDSWMQRSGPGSAMADNKGGMGFRVASIPERVSLEAASTKSPFDPATAANWSAGGTEWTVDAAVSHDGVDSVKAQTANGQSTYREYTLTGPAVVDFWWKVSSEELYDTFSYSLNGVNQQTISGAVDWTYRTLTLPAGTHTIRWTYTKDESGAVGQDAGWLDDFVVYPATATLQVRDGSTVLDDEVTVDFGSADTGSTGFTKSLTFANEGYVPLEVQLSLPEGSPFAFDDGGATYELLVGRGESVDVPIVLSTAGAGAKNARLTISAPDSTVAPPSVTLTGYVRGPDIGLAQGATALTSGQTFDMGLAPRTVEFTIRNNGNVGDLVISAISATGNFQITQQPAATIPPQTSTTFKVLAQSVASGVQAGSISITSNAANLAEFSLPLSSKSLIAFPDGVTDGSMATSGTGGAAGWDFDTTVLPSGQSGQAFKTGVTPNSGGSVLEFTTETAGVVSWTWKVSTQENFDWLLCEVDGQEAAGISTKNGVWQTQVVNVPAGANVRWVYRKDASGTIGEDAGYLADVEFRSFAANQSFGQWAQSNGVTDPLQRMPKSGLQAMFGWLGGFGVDGERDDDTHQAWILSGTLKYRYPISKTANGTQQILFSPNMSSWTTRRFSQRVVSEDANRIVIEATAPSGTKGFFKVVGDGYISSAMIEVQGECFAHPIKYQIEHDQFEVKLWFQSRSIGKTLQECLDQIAALGLRYNEEEVQELINQDRLQSVFAGTAVASFQLGKTEITWAEWQEVRDWAVANGYSDLAGVGAGSAGNHPVRDISWYDAVKWANAKSEIEGLSPVYFVGGGVYRTGAIQPTINPVAKGYRLPTEIEWEWAAMGGVYTSGFAHYIYSGSNDLELVGWFTGNAGGAVVDLYLGRGTWPVAQKAANELGLYDMSGNVWEWVDDVVGSARRLRGGGWPNEATECTIISRVGVHSPDYRHPAIGFRLARNAD